MGGCFLAGCGWDSMKRVMSEICYISLPVTVNRRREDSDGC